MPEKAHVFLQAVLFKFHVELVKLKIVTTCYYVSSNKLILFLEVQYSFDFDTKQSHT